jgi:hypothetical protein
MKLVTKLIVASTLATFMFGSMNLTWGNAYSNNATDELEVSNQFGVWLDVNDSMSFGWEGSGIKVGFAGPAGMTVRLGYDTTSANVGSTLGMSRTWWTSTGDGWGTSLSTALDFNMTGGVGPDALTGGGNTADDIAAGAWTLTMNLGFGF